ncbi:MAG: ankyrin repeat domain-containing protein [Pirellulales bacterium]|nr:ankyrin repeat domain-containing protein [Pirellulales bacterium]
MSHSSPDEAVLAAAVAAIQSGSVVDLERLLAAQPALATARLEACTGENDRSASKTLLHVATDWSGHFPHASETVRTLVRAGADVNARFVGHHRETPLHWAASCDDVDLLDTLIELGADLEADGGVIANGTPLANAVAFGQWRAANRLIEHGATATLWQAAGLGLVDRVASFFTDDSLPHPEAVTNAFWCACHGGQQEAAKYLLEHDADLNWIGHDQLTPLDAAQRSKKPELAAWLVAQGAISVRDGK